MPAAVASTSANQFDVAMTSLNSAGNRRGTWKNFAMSLENRETVSTGSKGTKGMNRA